MKCGHCKRDDAAVTVAHVRGCDGRQSFDPGPAPFASNKLNAAVERGLEQSLRDIELRGSSVATLDRPAPNRRERRDGINSDLAKARRAVPAGRYALKGIDGDWKFYKVDKPDEGRWKGYTFLKVLASEEEHRVKGIEAELTILLKIGADAAEASRAYGREIGACGICGRTLTNPDSIADGIGPICSSKMGW